MSETLVFVLGVVYLVGLAVVIAVLARATRKQLGEEEAAAKQRERRDS